MPVLSNSTEYLNLDFSLKFYICFFRSHARPNSSLIVSQSYSYLTCPRSRVKLAGIFQGSSTLLLGCGSSDPSTAGGLHVDVHAGDVVVLPAGTAHCSVESTLDYRYVGVYPKVK
jgi:hypothetical protein